MRVHELSMTGRAGHPAERGLEISLPRQREIVITLRAFHIFSVQLKNKAQGNGPLKMGTGLLPVPLIDLLTHESNLAKHPV